MNSVRLASEVYEGFWARLFGVQGLPKDGEIKFEWDPLQAEYGLAIVLFGIALFCLFLGRKDAERRVKIIRAIVGILGLLLGVFLLLTPRIVLPTPSYWVFPLLIALPLAGLAGVLYTRAERRDVGVGPKILLTGFRVLLLLLVAFLLFGPHLVARTIEKKRSFVIVLLDNSSSMGEKDLPLSHADRVKLARVTGISDDDFLSPEELRELRKLTRAKIVERALRNKALHVLEDLEAKLEVRYFTFSGRPTGYEDDRETLWKEYDPKGSTTAIGEAMQRALYLLKKKSVVPVLVFSDFRNNSGIDPVEVARQFNGQYVSVYTVLAGIPQLPRDIALLEPEGESATLAKERYKLGFKIRHHGFAGQEVRVDLWVHRRENGKRGIPSDPAEIEKLIADPRSRKETDTTVRLGKEGEKQSEQVVFEPKEPGDYLLILKVEPREGESSVPNNYLVRPLRVADEKIKVLYIEGPARWEYRFLKNALIRDTQILCHCLLTSADEGVPQEHTKIPEDKKTAENSMFVTPLKEFPQTLQQLVKYDVVILGDIDPTVLGGEAQWENLETFVTEFGGGLILLSGHSNPRLFMDKSPLRRLLPVDPDLSRIDSSDLVYDRQFGYALTADALGKDGRNPHSIILYEAFAEQPEKNQEHWEDNDKENNGQVSLRWFVRTRGLAENASALVEIKGAQGVSKRPPLFVTQYNGRGRVFWSGTDETYRWRYLRGDYPWFYPFWQRAMKWVRRGKLHGEKRYRISVDKERYLIQEEVKVYASAYDKTYRRQSAPKLIVYVEPPEGKRIPVELTKDKSRDGYYEGVYQPSDPGAFKIWAGEEDERTRDEARFTVEIASPEKNQPILDAGTAKAVAEASYQAWKSRKPRQVRDQFYTIDRVGELAEDVKASEHIMRTHPIKRYLWDSVPVWLFFALLITLEWVFRKVWRML